MRTSRRRQPGFTLVEMLAVMFLLAVVAGIMTLLLKDTLDLERGRRLGFDNLVRNHLLADQFRGDVARAISAPAKWRDYEANAHTLILQMSADSHVVYLWRKKSLRRLDFDKEQKTEVALAVDGAQTDVAFVQVATGPKMICLELRPLRQGMPLPGQTLEIAAALGGDWR